VRYYQSFRQTFVLGNHGKRILCLAAIVYFVGVAALWSWLPPVPRLRWKAPEYVKLLTFMPDGQLLLSASHGKDGYHGPIRFWDTRTGEQAASILPDVAPLNALAIGISADGRLLAWHDYQRLHLMDLPTRQEIAAIPTSPNGEFRFSPQGDALVYISGNNLNNEPTAVVVWDVATKQERFRLDGEDSRAVWSPDGKILATGTRFRPAAEKEFAVSGDAKLWDAQTGQHLATLSGHHGAALYLEFSPDGQVLAAGCERGLDQKGDSITSLKLWNMTSYHEIATIERVGTGKGFLPRGHLLVTRQFDSTSKQGVLKYWDAAAGQVLRTIGPRDETDVGQWGWPEPTADGRWLMIYTAFQSKPHALRSWFAKLTGDPSMASYRFWSEVTLYDAGTGQQEATMPVGDWPVLLSPDGQALATATADEISIWELPPAKPLVGIFGWPLMAVGLVIFLGKMWARNADRKLPTAK
jgi:WD40 repeat protein